MKKKIAAVAVCLALAATAVTGASLAYFTDTDAAENQFVSGNVQIRMTEQQRGTDNAGREILVDFQQDKNLLPYTGDVADTENRDLDKNYVDKIVNVTNTGSEDAYVRVLVAVPHALEKALHVDWCGESWTVVKSETQTTIGDHVNDIYVITYNTALAAGQTSADPAVTGLFVDPLVDWREEQGYILNGQPIGFDLTETEISVTAQAVQAAGFDSAEDAFAAAKLPVDAWAENA